MSPSIRLHVPGPLSAGAAVAPSAGQAHYLGAVMRRGAGEALLLFNGSDGEWLARIEWLKRDAGLFAVERRIRPQLPRRAVTLAFAVLKRDATELVVQKATELGATRLCPVLTARTGPARLNADRLRAIATEAAEQCERLDVPAIDPAVTLDALLADWPVGPTLVAAIERGGDLPLGRHRGAGGLLVGPEGGFTGAELDALRRHPFVLPASLGPLILRAETAAIAGLALLQAAGDQA